VIDARAEGAPGEGMMNGPMMRALLEDRFQLKVRHESREVPVYELTAGKNGAKVHQFQEGTCTTHDPNLPMPPPVPGGNPCMYVFQPGKESGLLVAKAQGATFDHFCKLIAFAAGRPVVNKTGLTGLFDFRVEFAPDENTPFSTDGGPGPDFVPPPAAQPAGPSLFVALQEQLGLKLEPGRGPRDFLVIDGVKRPSEN
jgi:uncharacterized protein (TIGR03435 family)